MYRIGIRINLYFELSELFRASIKFPIKLKKILDRKSTKTNNNNRNIIGLNRKGRLKHRIKIFFGWST